MMQSDPEFQAFKDRVILANHSWAEQPARYRAWLRSTVSNGPKRTTLVKVDDDVGKWFDASPLWTENQNVCPSIHERHAVAKHRLSLIPRKNSFYVPLASWAERTVGHT